MSYERKVLRLLGGSLNLLPPGDKVAPQDALQMLNFRVDQNGVLRSRTGTSYVGFVGAGDGSDGRINTIALSGHIYYLGMTNGSLYRIWDGLTPIATGFDGLPLAIVPLNGYAWVMNRALQGKDDGETFSEWQITGPTTAPLRDPAVIFQTPDANGPAGTYTYYVTFADADYNESDPSPASLPISTDALIGGDDIPLAIPISPDPNCAHRLLYRNGGQLGGTYQVLDQADNITTEVLDSMPDSAALTLGIQMQADHDPPPQASGMVGPYFSRLVAFSSVEHPNRIWWTRPDQPSYFPGSNSEAGQWADVGDDGEAIVAVTMHPRSLVIYKEYTIWRLNGDPDSGTLEQTHATMGLLGGPQAVINAGDSDYFRGPDGLYVFNLDVATKLSPQVDPIFLGQEVNIGFGVYTDHADPTAADQTTVMGFSNGRVLMSYTEVGVTGSPNFRGNTTTLVYHLATNRFARMTLNGEQGLDTGFNALSTHGPDTFGATGSFLIALGLGDGVQDFSIAGAAIPLAYQSGFQDCGYSDNTKVLLDLVLDLEMNLGGGTDVATVAIEYDNGTRPGDTLSTTVSQNARGKVRLSFPEDPNLPGRRCTNFAVVITCAAQREFLVHGMYISYYVEARQAQVVATLPLALAGGKLVETKELQIEADTSDGAATVTWSSDLPGNAIAVRQTKSLATSPGQRNFQVPFSAIVEGRLFQFQMTSTTDFRLYGAKVLMRAIGVFVEAYEAGLGFVWDSMELSFESGLTHIPRGMGIALYMNPIKQAREIELQIDTVGPVTVGLLTDLPGNAVALRYQTTIDTGNVGWRVVKIPLPLSTAYDSPEPTPGPVEGRLYRVQIVGSSQYKLYAAAIEILPVGVYVEGYEAIAGAMFDSRALDFGTPKAKEARELELDIDTPGVTVQLLSDLPSLKMAQCFTTAANAIVTTGGRQKIMIPLTAFPEGRLWQMILTGANAFKLYGARLKIRALGTYVTVDEATNGALWDSTQLDLGTQKAKQFRELEVEIWTYGPVTLTATLDLFGNAPSTAVTATIDTSATGRRKVQIPLTQPSTGDPTTLYQYGRLLRVIIGASSAFKLFGARVNYREVGTLIEAYEAAAGAVWDSTPVSLGVNRDKVFDQVRFEMDSDGGVTIQALTDLPGETLTVRYEQTVSTVGFGRRWVTLELPADTQGRLIQVVVSSTAGLRLFQGEVSFRSIGRYLAANVPDAYRTLEQEFGSERIKYFKQLEVDVATDGPLTLTLYTNQSGSMASVFTTTINTGGLRQTLRLTVPANTRGRLARLQIGGASSGRLYKARVWTRPVNEPGAQWSWQDFPVEESDALPRWAALPVAPTPSDFAWSDLPVEPTPPGWEWAPFPVNPTDAQWNWVKVMPVEETAERWEWMDLGVTESGGGSGS